MAHDSFATGGANKIATETDQATGGNHELQLGAAIIGIFHVLHLAFTDPQFFDAGSHRFLGHIQHEGFKGFVGGAIDRAEDHLGLAHLELIALAAHCFDQNSQVKLTAAAHRPAIRGIGVFHPQGHVGEQFLLQPIADLTAGHEFAFLARKR